MYEVIYLPTAKQELEDAVMYIARGLASPEAAYALADAVDCVVCSLSEMPYRHAVYHSMYALEQEVRFVPVKNYNLFYVVYEEEKVVEIRRFLYQRRDTGTTKDQHGSIQ